MVPASHQANVNLVAFIRHGLQKQKMRMSQLLSIFYLISLQHKTKEISDDFKHSFGNDN